MNSVNYWSFTFKKVPIDNESNVDRHTDLKEQGRDIINIRDKENDFKNWKAETRNLFSDFQTNSNNYWLSLFYR